MKKTYSDPELEIIEIASGGVIMDQVEDSSAWGGSEPGNQGGIDLG